jgi:hypothetical protein
MSTTPSYTPIDWILRDDMAVLCRCSVDTIRRDVRNHELKARTDDAGRVLVNVGEFIKIGRLNEADLAGAATPAESASLVRSRAVESGLRQELAELRGRLERADQTSEVLREQLGVKDRQLKARDEQINTLTAMIGRTYGVTGGVA